MEESTSISRHSSPLGTWEFAWRRPAGPLHGVHGYVGYDQRLATPAAHRGIPRPALSLAFSFGPPQTVRSPGEAARATTVRSFAAGLYDRHVLVEAEAFHGIQVDLDPLAAVRLLGGRLRELTNRTVGLEDVLGAEAARLTDDLATAHGWDARFACLDRRLAAWLDPARAPAAEVAHAWRLISSSGGRVPVGDLAAEVGWSARHLRARFRDELGLSPKRMGRLVRFDAARTLLARPAAPELALVAAHAGYCDQAHLSHEVVAFSGLSPARLRASALPDGGGVYDQAEP